MRHQGSIAKWNDERGFEFITPSEGGDFVFVHISSLPRSDRRPSVNEGVSYTLGFDAHIASAADDAPTRCHLCKLGEHGAEVRRYTVSNMKYKILKSIAHNFSHSFVSYTNYFDDGHVVDDLLQLARKANGERVSIHWIPDSPSQRAFPPRVMKSIAHYKEWLPTQIQNSGASVEAIREFRTDIFLKPNKQVAVEAYLVDDRGKEHICNVSF